MPEPVEHGHRVFLFCDDPSHVRRVAITNFIFRDPGWGDEYTRRNGIDYGMTLGEDGPRPAGQDPVSWSRSGPKRTRYALRCRKCDRPLQLRAETLWPALDALARHGVAEVSLSVLAAIVMEQSKNDRAAPS